MFVSIASLRQPTFKSQLSQSRPLGQSMRDYLDDELVARVELVRRKIKIAAKAAREDHGETACVFFTLPEFFWNIPWREVRNEEELHELNAAYLEKVPACIALLMTELPVERYGKIVLLAEAVRHSSRLEKVSQVITMLLITCWRSPIKNMKSIYL